MGTQKEEGATNGEDGNEEIIFWTEVSQRYRQELNIKLNPKHLYGMDWSMLADYLGYNTETVEYFRSQDMDNTLALFNAYDKVEGASLNVVAEALHKMKRHDCSQIVENAKREVKESRKRRIAHGNLWMETPSDRSCSNCSRANHSSHLVGTCPNLHQCCASNRPPYSNPFCGTHYNSPNLSSCNNTRVNADDQQCLVKRLYSDNSDEGSNLNSRTMRPYDLTVPHHQKLSRQISEECNVHPGFNGDKRIRVDIGVDQSDKYASHAHDILSFVKPETNKQDNDEKFIQGTTSHNLHVELVSSKELSSVPDRLQPAEEFQSVIGDKMNPQHGYQSLDSANSRSSNNRPQSRNSDFATFPRDHRQRSPQAEDLATSQLKKLEISKKSISVPKDLKPNNYRIAFRHIRVFVTFSNESKSHRSQVLSLCRFLIDNNFACCVDEGREKDTLEFTEWYKSRFAEADFILACVTPTYLRDISQPAPAQGVKRLHSLEIYELMNSEFLNNQVSDSQSPSRFVPLLFKSTPVRAQLPPCLRQNQAYQWHEDYMDLIWLLSKPKERSRISSSQDFNLEKT